MNSTIYKKYAIEVVVSHRVSGDVRLESSPTYNGSGLNLNCSPIYLNTINYLDDYGIIVEYPRYFDTYKDAFNLLNTQYIYLRVNVNVHSVKIVELYNDIQPPIKVLRKLKLKEIVKII